MADEFASDFQQLDHGARALAVHLTFKNIQQIIKKKRLIVEGQAGVSNKEAEYQAAKAAAQFKKEMDAPITLLEMSLGSPSAARGSFAVSTVSQGVTS